MIYTVLVQTHQYVIRIKRETPHLVSAEWQLCLYRKYVVIRYGPRIVNPAKNPQACIMFSILDSAHK